MENRHPVQPPAPADTVAALIGSRRTIHLFDTTRAVPDHLITMALEVAIQAPNHRTTEPWRFYRFGPETRSRLIDLNSEVVGERHGEGAAADKRLRWQQIPGFLAVTCQRSDDVLREQEDFAACACAVQNLMLALWSAGVGTKWTTGAVTREARFYELIGADVARESTIALVQYGYPAAIPTTRRSPLEDVTYRLS